MFLILELELTNLQIENEEKKARNLQLERDFLLEKGHKISTNHSQIPAQGSASYGYYPGYGPSFM